MLYLYSLLLSLKIDIVWISLFCFLTQFINHKVHFQNNQNWNKSKKEEIVPKDFDSVHSAVNAKLKTSNKKQLIDLILNSPRIRLSRSENII